jgi:phytoene synthase
MVSASTLSVARAACREITRRHARTFYFASRVLPAAKRTDAYAVYAFCRHADDAIDHAPGEVERYQAALQLRTLLALVYAGDETPDATLPWLPAFRETVVRRAIPQRYFDDLLTGVEMDRGRVRIANWPELDRYCYHVASVVGLIMVHVFAEPTPERLGPARDLGTAMQLTNILRDIREDWTRDRLYLPTDELEKFGLGEDDMARVRVTEPFRAFMRFQIDRARGYYAAAQPGIVTLPGDGTRFAVRLMRTIYGGILDEIERADYDVFSRRARVSLPRKIWLAAHA